MKKHGLYGTPLYNIWHGMKSRCYQPSNKKSFHDYGGRGITICDRWLTLEHFVADMLPSYFKGATIERKDVDGPYSPDNCIWATSAQQARNKRSNVPLTFNGRTQCIAAWAEEVGIDYKTIYSRLFQANWTVERALTTPTRPIVKRQPLQKDAGAARYSKHDGPLFNQPAIRQASS